MLCSNWSGNMSPSIYQYLIIHLMCGILSYTKDVYYFLLLFLLLIVVVVVLLLLVQHYRNVIIAMIIGVENIIYKVQKLFKLLCIGFFLLIDYILVLFCFFFLFFSIWLLFIIIITLLFSLLFFLLSVSFNMYILSLYNVKLP